MDGTLRFHLDEHVSPKVAEGLRRRGIEASTSQERALLHASDKEQLVFARSEGWVLVTRDRDFLREAAAGTHHAGIVYADMNKPVTIGQFVRELMVLHANASPEDMRNHVAYL